MCTGRAQPAEFASAMKNREDSDIKRRKLEKTPEVIETCRFVKSDNNFEI